MENWWKNNKMFLSLIPALIFWGVSMVFFVVGLKFGQSLIIFGFDVAQIISISLAISITVVQIIGNDTGWSEADLPLRIGWLGSYMLGIGTNVVGILSILSIESKNMEFVIALGLGTMIEVMPERLLVKFFQGLNEIKKTTKTSANIRSNPKPNRPRIQDEEIDAYPPMLNREQQRILHRVKQQTPSYAEKYPVPSPSDMPFAPSWAKKEGK